VWSFYQEPDADVFLQETYRYFSREALDRASAESCQFAWGAAEAGHVLGKVYSARQQWNDARAALQQALATRRQIGDPRAEITQDLLGSIPG
jgi:uncharacterized protein HemY